MQPHGVGGTRSRIHVHFVPRFAAFHGIMFLWTYAEQPGLDAVAIGTQVQAICACPKMERTGERFPFMDVKV